MAQSVSAQLFNSNPNINSQLEFQIHVKSALALSVTATNQEQIDNATQTLQIMQNMNEYIPALIHIIHCTQKVNYTINMAELALVQLKNVLRRQWGPYWHQGQIQSQSLISAENRKYLLQNLMSINVYLSENYKYSKIVKDIIVTVGKEAIDYDNEVEIFLQQGTQLRASMNYLIGVALANRLRESESNQQKIKSITFLRKFIPMVLHLIHQGESNIQKKFDQIDALPSQYINSSHYMALADEYKRQKIYFDEIVYKSIKFMKAVLMGEISTDLRFYAFKFAEVSMGRLREQSQKYVEEAQNYPEDCGVKGNDKFNYMHSKKWANKYMCLFVDHVLIHRDQNRRIDEGSKEFIETYRLSLMEIVTKMLTIPQPKKVKYYQLKLLEKLIVRKVFDSLGEFQAEMKFYKTELLPQFIRFTKEDMKLATEQPLEFINLEKEDPFSVQLSKDILDIRSLAAFIWCILADPNSVYKINGNQQICAQKQLVESLEIIYHWISSNNDSDCEMGAYILYKLNAGIIQTVNLQQYLSASLRGNLLKFLNNGDHILFMRAMKLVDKYDKYIEDDIMTEVKKFIMIDISEGYQIISMGGQIDAKLIIKLTHSIIAFYRVFRRPTLRQLDQPSILMSLDVMLTLTRKYENEEVMQTLSFFVDFYNLHITDHACQLIKLMGQNFNQYYTRHITPPDCLENMNFDGNLLQLAKNSIQVIRVFAESSNCKLPECISPQDQSINREIQNQIISMLSLVYSKPEGDLEFQQELLVLLNTYLHHYFRKKQPLSPSIWFFYRLIIFRLTGLSEKAKKVYVEWVKNQMFSMQQFQMQQPYSYRSCLQVLRNYIKYINPAQSIADVKNIYKHLVSANNMEVLFYFVLIFYKLGQNRQFVRLPNLGRQMATMLLIFLLQNHGKALQISVFMEILHVIIKNIKLGQTWRKIVRYNIQLFSLWLWAFGVRAEQKLLTSENIFFQKLLFGGFPLAKIYEFKQGEQFAQRTRMILGLSNLIKLFILKDLPWQRIKQYMKAIIEVTLVHASQLYVPYSNYEYQDDSQQQQASDEEDNQTFINPKEFINLNNLNAAQNANELVNKLKQQCQREYYYVREEDDDGEEELDDTSNEEYISNLEDVRAVEYFLDMLCWMKDKNYQLYRVLVIADFNYFVYKIVKYREKQNKMNCQYYQLYEQNKQNIAM